MKSSRSESDILRGAEVSGVVFCTPSGEMETQEERQQQDQQNLQALEQYWHNKGLKEGKLQGFDEGYQEGEKEGHRKGLQEGLERGREEGLAEGNEKGLKEGIEKAQQELDQALAIVNQLTSKLNDEVEGFLGKNHAELISFTLCVCERILRRELSQQDNLQKLIQMLFDQAGSILKGKRVDISVHPDDLELLEGGLAFLKIDSQLRENTTLIANPSLERGNCQLDTDLGLLNFDIRRQLDSLEKRLLEISEGEVVDDPPEEPEGTHAEAGQGN